MNKENILNHLEELKSRLDKEVDGFNIDNRVEEIERINEQIKALEDEQNRNEELLSNDENFIDNTPFQFYEMQLAEASDYIENCQKAETENSSRIGDVEVDIDNLNAIIESLNDRQKQIGENNIQLNLDIRRARITSDNTMINDCTAKIARNDNESNNISTEIIALEERIQKQREEIARLETEAVGLAERTKEANDRREEVVQKYEAADKREVDLAKRNSVVNRNKDIQIAITDLNNKSKAIEYNFSGELSTLIEDYRNSTIDENQMKERLSKIRSELPAEFLQQDQAQRNAELAQNKISEDQLEVTVERLTVRLSNEDNYRVAPSEYARIRAKLSSCKNRMSEYNAEEAVLQSTINTNKKDILEYQEYIEICEKDNRELQRQIIINNGVDKELEAELRAKQESNFSGIREANEMIASLEKEEQINPQVLAVIQERKQRTENLIKSYQEKLANENAIDKSKVRLDQLELARAHDALVSLRNRDEALNNSILAAMDAIIAGQAVINNTAQPANNLPFPTTASIDPQDIGMINPQNTQENKDDELNVDAVNLNDLNVVIDNDSQDSSVEVDEDDLDLGTIDPDDLDFVVSNVNINNDSESLEDNIDDKENIDEEDELVPVTYTDADSKLKEKAKSNKFVAAFKKHWLKVLAVVGMIALVVGMKGCSSNLAERFTDDVINNDTAMEEIVDSDDAKDAISQLLDDEMQKAEDAAKEQNDKNNGGGTGNGSESNDKDIANPGNGNTGTGDGSGGSAPYTETTPGSDEQVAPPVDPSTIVDTNADETPDLPHQDPVDPADIPDPNPTPSDETVVPPETPDEGTTVDEEGVTGEETVPDDAWENEDPVIPDETEVVDTETPDENVTGDETVPDDAWENEEPVIEDPTVTPTDETTVENTVIEETSNVEIETPTVEPTLPVSPDLDREPDATIPEQPVQTETTNIVIEEGEAFILPGEDGNYVYDNNSGMTKEETDKDIFANDDVQSVTVNTDEAGNDVVTVEINSSALEKTDSSLTEEDTAAISASNEVADDDVAAIEAQYKAQQEALEKLKEQVISSNEVAPEEESLGISK